ALAAILICLGASPAAAQTVTLEHNHPAATMQLSSARRAASYRRLNLKAFLALRNQADLDKLLADQQTPGSSEYQHWLTPKEFDARFAPTGSDLLAVAEWLHSEGFQVTSWSQKDRYVGFTG